MAYNTRMTESLENQEILVMSVSAIGKIKELIDGRGRGELAVRVVVSGQLPGGAYQTEFKFITPEDQEEDDVVQDTGSFVLLYTNQDANSLQGARVDFDEQKYSAGFHIEYPIPKSAIPDHIEQKRDWIDPNAIAVQEILDKQVNPGVAVHGGWVLLLDVRKNTAFIEMGGGCQGCGQADITMKQGIEFMITEKVPAINRVIDRTEHADGTNPYYTPAAAGESPFG